MRWHNPALGNVSPDEFIPVAEQNGLIESIGQFVLSEALGMAARWQTEHKSEIRIAVNLSPRQFSDPQLVGYIENTIQ